MNEIVQFFKQFYDVAGLVKSLGAQHFLIAYSALFAIIFAETGLLVGFFLPGDSLLFAAGLACAPGNQLQVFNIFALNAVLIPAAIIGDTVGYWIGYKLGGALYLRKQTLFFRKDHLLATKDFYERHGGKTIILARFVPLIRTFAPVVAGIGQMSYRRFLAYNVFGGIGWIIVLSTLGYFLGQRESIRNNLELTILLIIFVSLLPAIIGFIQVKLKNRAQRNQPPPGDGALSVKNKTADGISPTDG